MKLALFVFVTLSFIVFLASIVYKVLRETMYYWTMSVSDYRRTLNTFRHAHLKPKAKQRLYRDRVLYTIYSAISIIVFVGVSYVVGNAIVGRSF